MLESGLLIRILEIAPPRFTGYLRAAESTRCSRRHGGSCIKQSLRRKGDRHERMRVNTTGHDNVTHILV
jgi:hypothetical protein